MLPSFILLPNRADSTAPIWLLPSPPLPLMTIIRLTLVAGDQAVADKLLQGGNVLR